MKIIATILLLSCSALAQDKRAISRAEVGCGPQDEKYEVKTDESQHPAPSPEDGKVRWTPLSRPFFACDKLISDRGLGFGFCFPVLQIKDK